MLELILTTESKVVATNLADFEQKANKFLAELTQTFETDDDFAKAKDEVKILNETEDKIKLAIDGVLNGSKDIAALIETAKGIAERFREERLSREKRVKERETEIKQGIVNAAYQRILAVKSGFEMEVSLALERNLPKAKLKERLEKATARRSTLNTLTAAVNAEENSITAEIGVEAARLSARRKLIPITYDYLFKDWLDLISGEQELEPIIQSRIEAEQQREAELKAKAEREAAEKAKVQAEATAIANEMEAQAPATQAVENAQRFANLPTADSVEPLADFIITIRLTQTTQTQAVTLARQLKAQFGDGVSLNKAK